MGIFKRKKDKRIEEISTWARNYLEERRHRASEAEKSGDMEVVTTVIAAQDAVQEIALPQEIEEAPAAALQIEGVEVIEEDVTTSVLVEEVSADQEAAVEEAAPPEVEVPIAEEAQVEVESQAVVEEAPIKPTLLQRLRSGLTKTREGLVGRMDQLFSLGQKINSDTLEELEEILIESDMGVHQALSLIQKIQEEVQDLQDPAKIKAYIRQEMAGILQTNGYALNRPDQGPYVIMVVGVNGVGKTTTIGKLAWRYVQQGEQVLLAAGDTFRAAATEQLEIWGGRVGADVVKHKSGADPSAVVFDALKAAQSRGAQVVIADTAGRLHTKINLMEELKKMKRVMTKVIPGAPHEILLVLDATTGQNALSQAKTFHEAIGVTGIVLTKLDGTAKGGIVTAIVGELGLPVKLIGIGEGMEDLRDFEPEEFVGALFDE